MSRRPLLCRQTLLAGLLIVVLGSPAGAAPVVLLSNGPATNRLNIAVLAEGYTASQTNLFLVAATNAVRALLSEPPLSDYSNHFNAVALFVASAQSGSDHPGNSQADTYFNSTYGPQDGPVITIPPNWASTNFADGQGKVDALVTEQAPDTDLTILLVNDPVNGGSDGSGGVAIAAATSMDALIHEVGHVLGNLGDEYEWANPGYPDIEEPNTTRETNRAAIKWNAWIATNTPVPTPPTAFYDGVVGLFEGAHYHSSGWYRPRFDCRMRTPTQPYFCEVCGEALVLALYQHVRPVDARTPADTNVSVTTASPVNFGISPVQPATHALTVQWFTNHVAVNGSTGTNLTVQPSTMGNGVHTVRADIFDPTPRVRTDPGQLREQSVSWTVNIALSWLQLDSPVWAASQFRFRVAGLAPEGFVVESSSNLTTWASVATNQLVAGEAWVTNAVSGNGPRLYRVRAR